jgi:hypothetical protein
MRAGILPLGKGLHRHKGRSVLPLPHFFLKHPTLVDFQLTVVRKTDRITLKRPRSGTFKIDPVLVETASVAGALEFLLPLQPVRRAAQVRTDGLAGRKSEPDPRTRHEPPRRRTELRTWSPPALGEVVWKTNLEDRRRLNEYVWEHESSQPRSQRSCVTKSEEKPMASDDPKRTAPNAPKNVRRLVAAGFGAFFPNSRDARHCRLGGFRGSRGESAYPEPQLRPSKLDRAWHPCGQLPGCWQCPSGRHGRPPRRPAPWRPISHFRGRSRFGGARMASDLRRGRSSRLALFTPSGREHFRHAHLTWLLGRRRRLVRRFGRKPLEGRRRLADHRLRIFRSGGSEHLRDGHRARLLRRRAGEKLPWGLGDFTPPRRVPRHLHLRQEWTPSVRQVPTAHRRPGERQAARISSIDIFFFSAI